MSTEEALGRFLREVAGAAVRLADELSLRTTPEAEKVRLPEEDHPLGTRQKQIVALQALRTDEGVKTSDIARQLGDNDVPNTYTSLQALARAGIVENVPGRQPQHWRLTPTYRGNSSPYLDVAAQIRPGEWATYGDVAIAAGKDIKAARAVGRAAATLEEFPNPHRLLPVTGKVPEGWGILAGLQPDECRLRLESEGVVFDQQGVADPARRVRWDELAARTGLDLPDSA
jgi:alkylated DNA nucleotide flippase Atl1